jgi:hypothetical protein
MNNLYDILTGNNINYMAAAIDPDGNVQTSQAPGEIYSPEAQAQVSKLPGNVRNKVHKNILTGQYIDKVYQKFLNSVEGKEYVDMLRRRGNGKSNPGRLEEIIVANQGDGIVAATMPGYVKANIIINADFIDNYAQSISSRWGLEYDDVLNNILVHEMNHYFLQGKKDFKKPEFMVEFHNDFSSIEFYMDLAKKYPQEASFYTRKAEVFTERYGGKALDKMQKYITKNASKEDIHKETVENEYLNAA